MASLQVVRFSGDRSGPVFMKPLLSSDNAAFEPTGVWIGTSHNEYVSDLVLLNLSQFDCFASELIQGDRLLLNPQSLREV